MRRFSKPLINKDTDMQSVQQTPVKGQGIPPASLQENCSKGIQVGGKPINLDQAASHAFFIANTLLALHEVMPEDMKDGPRVAARCMVGDLADIAEQLGLALGGYGGTLINGVKVGEW